MQITEETVKQIAGQANLLSLYWQDELEQLNEKLRGKLMNRSVSAVKKEKK